MSDYIERAKKMCCEVHTERIEALEDALRTARQAIGIVRLSYHYTHKPRARVSADDLSMAMEYDDQVASAEKMADAVLGTPFGQTRDERTG